MNNFQHQKKIQHSGEIIWISGMFSFIMLSSSTSTLNSEMLILKLLHQNMKIEHLSRENIGKPTKCYFNKTLEGSDIIKCPNEVVLSKESRI